jgi:hypothetical protein
LNRGIWGEGNQVYSDNRKGALCGRDDGEREGGKKEEKIAKIHITQKRHAIWFPLNEEKESLFSFFLFLSLILCSFSLGEKKEE